jgi:hypothetical protein
MRSGFERPSRLDVAAVVFSNVLTGCLPLRVTLRSALCIVYVRRRAPPDGFAIVAPQAAILQGTL